jgi:ELWxxDGT repeat protein
LYKLTHAGGTLFFSAHDPIHGRELWKSDGTADGTIMVKEIATVPFPTPGWDASPLYLTSVNNTLFFVANDGIHGYELWRSDGTEAGTVMVKDINPSGTASLGQLTNVNGTLFFKANDGIHGSELWKSDGTEASTVMVQDINPSGDASPGKLTVVDGKLFFKADDGVHGNELWATETIDSCPDDSNKLDPGMCGCGVAETDTDSDGYPDCIDCRSDDPISYPMAPEVYDGIDNNCNGRVDEGCGPTPAEITELDPFHGGYGTKIKIKGSGFGEQQTGMIEPGRGFYSIVSFSYSGFPMPLIATRCGKWTNTALRVALEKLFMDLNADGLQQYDEPLIGMLQPDTVTITFSSIHFEDVNANGAYDEDDSIIEAVTSNTQEFSLTNAPVIKAVTSVDGTIGPGSTIVVKGYGFQSSQGDSSFFINNAEFGSGHKRIKLWTDTKIKVKIPFKNKLCQWYKHGDGEYRKRKVWVTVGGINSNVKRIKVNRPAGCESCTENADCEPGQYCAKPLGSCETSGDCAPLPDYCFDLWAPVCGCDGNTYSNSCTAASWGVNVAYEGECLP